MWELLSFLGVNLQRALDHMRSRRSRKRDAVVLKKEKEKPCSNIMGVSGVYSRYRLYTVSLSLGLQRNGIGTQWLVQSRGNQCRKYEHLACIDYPGLKISDSRVALQLGSPMNVGLASSMIYYWRSSPVREMWRDQPRYPSSIYVRKWVVFATKLYRGCIKVCWCRES